MPLGTEVDVGPSDIMLDGDPTQIQTGGGVDLPSPIFSPCLLWLSNSLRVVTAGNHTCTDFSVAHVKPLWLLVEKMDVSSR